MVSEQEAWPEDVPPPVAAVDEDSEAEALHALHRELQRQRWPAEPPKAATTSWAPAHPIALAVWQQLPESGRGVDYWRVVRMVADKLACGLWVAQQAALGLALVGRAYVSPTENREQSWIGRGDDPRVGDATYRTGALGGMGG